MNYIAALIILGIFSQRSLAKSLVESSTGCTDFCYNVKSISDQQPMLQQQLKTIENNWMIQKNWTEQLETHLGRLFSVVHKLMERQGINRSDSSEMTNLSDRLNGLEKRLAEQQERAALAKSTATKRLDQLEDNQRQLVSGSQQMLERLNQFDIQIGEDTAKIGNSISGLDKLRDRVEVLEKQILQQDENVSLDGLQDTSISNVSLPESLAELSSPQDLLNNQQKIESDRKTMEDIRKRFSQMFDERKLSEPQTKVPESQDREEQTSAPEETVSLGNTLEHVLSGPQDSITSTVSQLADGLKEHLPESPNVKEIIGNLPNKLQKIDSQESNISEMMNKLQNMFVGQKMKVGNYESNPSDLQTKLSELQKKLLGQSTNLIERIPNSLENEINPR